MQVTMSMLDPESLAAWTLGSWKGGIPSEISGVSADTRTLRRGDLFVAIKGPRFDGHDFLQQAFEQGASGAVVAGLEPGFELNRPMLLVRDTMAALRHMAAGYRKKVGAEVVAVTGSVGKTTVKEMVADVLSLKASTARTRGNWNNAVGLPLSLLSMDHSTRIGVFEVGTSRPGELLPLCRTLAPNWGLVTAVAPAHMESFDSIGSVAREKSELLASLPREGVAVLRNDRQWYRLLRSRARCRVIELAMDGDGDYVAAGECARSNSFRVHERATGEFFEFRLPLPGRHFAENALFAAAVGRGHGLSWADIARAIESFKPQPMRWESVCINGVNVINDAYNASPASMAAALQAFSGIGVDGRKWLVLGGMRELGAFQVRCHADLGMRAAKGPWAGLVVVGPLGALIAEGAETAGLDRERVFRCAGHAEAASVLNRLAGPGDGVLLKGSRGEQLENVLIEWKKIMGALP